MRRAQDRTRVSQPHDAAMVFLVGPPGSGKSALGRRVCTELELRLVDLIDDGRTDETLQEVVRARGADVVTLPWARREMPAWLNLCRRSQKRWRCGRTRSTCRHVRATRGASLRP